MTNMVHGQVSGTTRFLRNRVRAARIRALPCIASVYRVLTRSVTSDFGHETLWELAGSYPAKYWTISGQEALVLGQLGVEGSGTLTLPYDADISEKDQVIYHEVEIGADVHLEVTAVRRATLAQATHAVCIELKFVEPEMVLG